MLIIHKGHAPKSIDIDCKDTLPVSVAFTSNGREIVTSERYIGGQRAGGRIRRCPTQGESLDKKAIVLVDTNNGVDGVAVSKDGQWIVSIMGNKVVVRNTTTDEDLEAGEHTLGVHTIDVSPDSTRFASGSEDKTVRIFSITTGQRLVGPLQHSNEVVGVKFSPSGERLATAAAGDPVRVWDARTGNMFLQTRDQYFYTPTVNLTQTCTPLGWSSDSQRVFVVASLRIASREITCQCISVPSSDLTFLPLLWSQSVPASNDSTLYSLATNGRFIACSAGGFLSFWDPSSSTERQIGSTIRLQDSILSIALSSDHSYLACGRGDKKITVYALRDILPLHAILDPTSRLPLMNVSEEAFRLWIKQDLHKAEEKLSREINPENSNHYVARANRALIRASLKQWDTAIADATQVASHLISPVAHVYSSVPGPKSLAIQRSIIGHIAKAVALVGRGEHELAFETFDLVFRDCSADETRFLLLIKAILLFVAGKRENAIARVKDLIAGTDDSAMYNYLQARTTIQC
ncbi:hypothetical protein J3R83DRAFT_11721 [Lanmaoa asiatica]|nr:hypothetical protein J3R83DRAFT_11721 [Lanmaoa asiatica]